MPLISDTTKSEKINLLKPFSECLFYRILMKVDGYDNYTANLVLIKAELFPLRSYVRAVEIKQALDELVERGLISMYEADGKPFLHLHNNRQRLRWPKQLYPLAPGQKACSERSRTEKRSKKEKEAEAEVEVEVETEVEKEVVVEVEKETTTTTFLKKTFGKQLYNIAIDNFAKYFPEEKAMLDTALYKFKDKEISEDEEKKIRAKFITAPVKLEIEKFLRYNEAKCEELNQLKVNSLFFNWLEKKLQYEKK